MTGNGASRNRDRITIWENKNNSLNPSARPMGPMPYPILQWIRCYLFFPLSIKISLNEYKSTYLSLHSFEVHCGSNNNKFCTWSHPFQPSNTTFVRSTKNPVLSQQRPDQLFSKILTLIIKNKKKTMTICLKLSQGDNVFISYIFCKKKCSSVCRMNEQTNKSGFLSY